MSRENYIKSLDISQEPFEAIIMGFMRIADDDNLRYLKSRYASIWNELQARYNAPSGYLEGENPNVDRTAEKLANHIKNFSTGPVEFKNRATGIKELHEANYGRKDANT